MEARGKLRVGSVATIAVATLAEEEAVVELVKATR